MARSSTARSRQSVSASARDQKLNERAWPCTATRTFSSTERWGKMFVIWYDLAMPSRHTRCCGSPVMSASRNTTRPDDGAISPETRRKKVVLPAPLGPMMERSSPASDGERDRVHRHQAAEGAGEVLGVQQDPVGTAHTVAKKRAGAPSVPAIL